MIKELGLGLGVLVGMSSLFWLPNTSIDFSKFNTDFLPIIFIFLYSG